ncbi:ADP-ribosylglycohydrolase family protein [Chryseobacterium camelliae]|uniref:ADP-ribosylglycohydrolase family protein n=1 Tax=Chryseobacterium camelliae TaxID=1265445 RepID=UPI000C1C88C3|nr:ADP-ribosylglycohydrolase family protein [Chryseobacterium camelliae]
MNPETKYKGSLKLSAIGDALGWITEFEKNQQSLKDKFGTEKIENFQPWTKTVGGRFYGYTDNIRAGSYSDDTQLLLAVARSIKNDGSLDHEYFAKNELVSWLEYERGGGRTVKTAANKIQRKSANWFNNFYSLKINNETYNYKQSGANGAAMRVLPIALANLGDKEKIREEIFCNSIITHGHPRAIIGAMLYGYAINQIIIFKTADFTWEKYIIQLGSNFKEKFDLSLIKRKEITEWIKQWNITENKLFESIYFETLLETQNYLRFIFQSLKQNLSVRETLQKLGCFAPATKGSGISTVIAGIYLASKFHESPLSAIIEAVNALGSDTDSIAAFTGGLIGALHGHSIIPQKWRTVQDLEYLEDVAKRLLAISENRNIVEPTISINADLKLLNKIQEDNFKVDENVLFTPLGEGKIVKIDRQNTQTKGKYNLLIEVQLKIGQSILVSKSFDHTYNYLNTNEKNSKEKILQLAKKNIKKTSFKILSHYLNNHKNIPEEHLEILILILEDKRQLNKISSLDSKIELH